MEAVNSSETSINFFQITRLHIPEHRSVHEGELLLILAYTEFTTFLMAIFMKYNNTYT
jgi:hypothetical protein